MNVSKQSKVDETIIIDMAQELINRHGDKAIDIAQKRAEQAKSGRFPSDKDIAMLILTKVKERSICTTKI